MSAKMVSAAWWGFPPPALYGHFIVSDEDLWSIHYDDDDAEDMDRAELLEAMRLFKEVLQTVAYALVRETSH
jgi:hypothetical protein